MFDINTFDNYNNMRVQDWLFFYDPDILFGAYRPKCLIYPLLLFRVVESFRECRLLIHNG